MLQVRDRHMTNIRTAIRHTILAQRTQRINMLRAWNKRALANSAMPNQQEFTQLLQPNLLPLNRFV